MPLPPLRFQPILKERAWGGRSLARFGKAVPAPPAAPVGESWEIADLAPPVADGVSRVASGPFQGRTISQMIETHGAAMLGRLRFAGAGATGGGMAGRGAPAGAGARFPLLVKYLDAAENLSVQVHPTATYAAAHPGAHLKTEAWMVLAAAPGACIYRGVREDVTPAQFRDAVAGGTAVDLLVREAVCAGDCVPLESGLCHALGAGVVVAEVQTPSDTTFRVFDWNRNDPARPLHIEQAMECILFGRAQRLGERPVTSVARSGAAWADGLRAAVLCANEHFELEAVEASPSGDAAPIACATDGAPEVAMLVRGEAVIESEGHRPEHLRAGDTVLLPAELVPTTIDLGPEAMLLRALAPDASRRMRDGNRAGERLA